jgi:hypothetical protein
MGSWTTERLGWGGATNGTQIFVDWADGRGLNVRGVGKTKWLSRELIFDPWKFAQSAFIRVTVLLAFLEG